MGRSFFKYHFISILLIATGCTKESSVPEVNNIRVDTARVILKATGDFINGPYGVVSGRARIYGKGDSLLVALENFLTVSGPDLKVYLSGELEPVNFVNLGSLKAISGNQTYNCPVGVNISQYKYILIYCQQYKHLFGSAPL